VDEVPGRPGEAELYEACIDGKPQRTLAADVSDGVNGRAARDAALLMAETLPPGKRVTMGGDKVRQMQEFVRELRETNITPHVAQNTTNRRSAVVSGVAIAHWLGLPAQSERLSIGFNLPACRRA
jgi:hypothetical protein